MRRNPHKPLFLLLPVFMLSTFCNALDSYKTFSKADQIKSPRLYKVIIRVVRPRWRTQPPLDKIDQPRYHNIIGSRFEVANPDSDNQTLTKLNKLNPTFIFDRVYAKKVIFLRPDQVWRQPDGFSMHSVKLAIVEENFEPFDQYAINGTHILFNNVRNTNCVSHQKTFHFKSMFSAKEIQDMRKNKQCLMRFRLNQSYILKKTKSRSLKKMGYGCSRIGQQFA